MTFILVAVDCHDCGYDMRVRAFVVRPTIEEIGELAGSARCTRVRMFIVNTDGTTEETEP